MKKILSKYFSRSLAAAFRALAIITIASSIAHASVQTNGQTSPGRDVLLVLPLENSSTSLEHNWVGEGFADAMTELLNLPGLIVIPNDERELVYQRLRLPLTTLPSRATAIKLAREARATLVLLGTYAVTPAKDKTPAQLQVNARLIRVAEGRFEGIEHDLGGALSTVQEMQGRLAYEILYQRDRAALPFSRNQLVERATKVPQRAFESYVKGVMTFEGEKRVAYLTNALRDYARAKDGQVYAQAAFELGRFYYAQQKWKDAAEYFTKVGKGERSYAEAAFYAGFAFWQVKDLERSLGVLVPLATELPLTSIYNNAGAISIQAAIEAKKPEDRERLLAQGLNLLGRAAESAPEDQFVRFNHSYALFASGKYADAAERFQPLMQQVKSNGQSLFLYAKALERAGDRAQDAAAADNEARRFFGDYAKWQTAWEKGQTAFPVSPLIYSSFNLRSYFEKLRQEVEPSAGGDSSKGGTQIEEALAKARDLYRDGRDEEALPELRRILVVEPMNAEAYLIIGRIHQRRSNLDEAIGALKTAVFWDGKLIDAHILLGRIFLERGDRAMATTYANSALQIDGSNQEALALQRQVTMGGK
ncbi:MAG: tetratricopeptide repeat protein [Pyrinomonadaceae bacterium]